MPIVPILAAATPGLAAATAEAAPASTAIAAFGQLLRVAKPTVGPPPTVPSALVRDGTAASASALDSARRVVQPAAATAAGAVAKAAHAATTALPATDALGGTGTSLQRQARTALQDGIEGVGDEALGQLQSGLDELPTDEAILTELQNLLAGLGSAVAPPPTPVPTSTPIGGAEFAVALDNHLQTHVPVALPANEAPQRIAGTSQRPAPPAARASVAVDLAAATAPATGPGEPLPGPAQIDPPTSASARADIPEAAASAREFAIEGSGVVLESAAATAASPRAAAEPPIFLQLPLTAGPRGAAGEVVAATAPIASVPPAHEQITVHIARAADQQEQRITIRLEPPELGRVEVTMDSRGHDGMRVVLAVDRPETLDLLRRDASLLDQALSRSNVKLDGGLEFSLRQNPQGFSGQPEGQAQRGFAFDDRPAEAGATMADTAPMPPERLPGSGALDIIV